jgi:hypothetical protein
MRRVPVLEWHPYKEVVFKGFPVLYVDSYSDLTPDLLEKNMSLYDVALSMDMENLDLMKIYNERTLI